MTFLPLLSGGLGFAATAGPLGTPRLKRRIRPSDPAWPRAADWAALKDAVAGSLIEVPSLLAGPDALKNLRNPYWLGDQAAGTEVSGLLDAWTPAASRYAVTARTAADVAAGVTFARKHNLRLVIKGGGHSYLGTSNAPDSLLIWTRAMNEVTRHEAFVGEGCDGKVPPVPAVSAAAGAVWMDLYNVVTTDGGRFVQGGGCTTVGVAGNVQSGGFGSFSKAFGTASSALLEAEIVTADGRVRVVNDCIDPDLFWAIKGGGGGTFGVVTRVTVRTYELPKWFGFTGGRIQATSDAAFTRLIERFVGFYRDSLFNSHWGEQVKLGPGNTLELSMVSQGLDAVQAQAAWQPFFEWVNASPEQFTVAPEFTSGAWDARSWWDVENNPGMVRDTREGAPLRRGWWHGDQGQVGAFLHRMDSLWLPASLLDDDRQPKLVAALFAASRHKTVELHFNKGLAGAPSEAREATLRTAMNPAVVDAFALAIVAGGERPSYPGLARPAMDVDAARQDAREVASSAAALRKLVPNAGSYVSESDYFNTAWQHEYWGANHARLRAIKTRVDPEGLFFVYHGVGSEEWSDDGFTRL